MKWAKVFLTASVMVAAPGCGRGGQKCRRDLADGGCQSWITSTHCPQCPTGFTPVSSVPASCVQAPIYCQ